MSGTQILTLCLVYKWTSNICRTENSISAFIRSVTTNTRQTILGCIQGKQIIKRTRKKFIINRSIENRIVP